MFWRKKHTKEKKDITLSKSEITIDADGDDVLTKTENFMMYVITNEESKILGIILLTKAQAEILNKSCNEQGIYYKRSLKE